jgi:hypothetical protein
MIKNTTRHTLNRARYNISEMETDFQNDEVFSFNLSSFVQAARSITWHMNKQYHTKEGFNAWYEKKVIEMKNNSELQFLIKARNYSEKEGPIPTGATRTNAVSASIVLIGAEQKQDTPITKVANPLLMIEPPKQKTISRWFWDVAEYLDKGPMVYASKFKKAEIIEVCKNILVYLNNLVDECEKMFSNT